MITQNTMFRASFFDRFSTCFLSECFVAFSLHEHADGLMNRRTKERLTATTCEDIFVAKFPFSAPKLNQPMDV